VRVELEETNRDVGSSDSRKKSRRRVSLETESSLPEAIALGSGAKEEYLCSPDVGVSAREVPETARGRTKETRPEPKGERIVLADVYL